MNVFYKALDIDKDKQIINKYAPHPIQTYEWGVFRKDLGFEVEFFARVKNNKITDIYLVYFKNFKILGFSFSHGFLQRSDPPKEDKFFIFLKKLAKKYNAIFIKIEPNFFIKTQNPNKQKLKLFKNYEKILKKNCTPSSGPFYKYSCIIDLTKSYDDILKNMHPKNRYNCKKGVKQGVKVLIQNNKQAIKDFIELNRQTTKRKHFKLYNSDYFLKMYEALKNTDILHVFNAKYKGKTLASWISFKFKDFLYYPYGASSDEYRNIKASNVIVLSFIQFGQKNKLKFFDLWGCLPLNAKKDHPWFGFHTFKIRFNGDHVRFLGAYDFVVNKFIYNLEKFLKIFKKQH